MQESLESMIGYLKAQGYNQDDVVRYFKERANEVGDVVVMSGKKIEDILFYLGNSFGMEPDDVNALLEEELRSKYDIRASIRFFPLAIVIDPESGVSGVKGLEEAVLSSLNGIIIDYNNLFGLTGGPFDQDILYMDALKGHKGAVEAVGQMSLSTDRVEVFKELTRQMVALYKLKDEKYGGAFDKSIEKHGLTAAVVRMSDKMGRIENIVKGVDVSETDEGLMDTLIDLANYSIMTLSWLKRVEK